MNGPPPARPTRAAVALAAAAAAVAAVALGRELGGGGIGALRPVFVALAGSAAVACLLAARRQEGALASMLASLGATLAVGAAAALA
jgi:hypothetical protein